MQQVRIVSAQSDVIYHVISMQMPQQQTPVGFVAVQSLSTASEGSREQWWCVWGCSALPAAPRHPRTAGRCLLEQLNIPFARKSFVTSSTIEWSEDESSSFLWEVSPEGVKAVGMGKLRLGGATRSWIHSVLTLPPS